MFKFPPANTGETIRIKVPYIDRDKTEYRINIALITFKENENFYKLDILHLNQFYTKMILPCITTVLFI